MSPSDKPKQEGGVNAEPEVTKVGSATGSAVLMKQPLASCKTTFVTPAHNPVNTLLAWKVKPLSSE